MVFLGISFSVNLKNVMSVTEVVLALIIALRGADDVEINVADVTIKALKRKLKENQYNIIEHYAIDHCLFLMLKDGFFSYN